MLLSRALVDRREVVFIEIDELRPADLLEPCAEVGEGIRIRGELVLPDHRATLRVDELEGPALSSIELIDLDLHGNAVGGEPLAEGRAFDGGTVGHPEP